MESQRMETRFVEDTVQEIVPVPDEPNLDKTIFTASGGHLISFAQEDGFWVATVDKKLPPGFSKRVKLPVHCAKGFSVKTLALYSAKEQQSLIHLEQTSGGQQKNVVYIGPCGLKGGALFNWFGSKKCTMMFCFNDVWRCVCGYKCVDDSCWSHCTKHYQAHQCSGCHTVKRCPRSYKCFNCQSSTYCSNCCGCSERIAAQKEEKRRAEEEEHRRRAEEREAERKCQEARRRRVEESEAARNWEEECRRRAEDRESERKRREEAERKQKIEEARRNALARVGSFAFNIDGALSARTSTTSTSTVSQNW